MRAVRGMSRKALAKDAEVSEQFLGNLETGVGNASILLLSKLADTRSTARCHPGRPGCGTGGPDSQLAASLQPLRRKTRGGPQKTVTGAIRTRGHAHAARLADRAGGYLRGAGKSTLGALLARELRCRFVELDKTIEELSGMDTAQIHVMLGQSAYRRYDRQALESAVAGGGDGVVIATPGSIVSEAPTYSYLLASCFTVWIKASPEEHMARVIAQGDMPYGGQP